MFCNECGKQVNNEDKFCSNCGTKQGEKLFKLPAGIQMTDTAQTAKVEQDAERNNSQRLLTASPSSNIRMKFLGLIVLCVGIFLFFYAMTMSTTYEGVYNIGLLNERQNLLMAAGFVSLIGVVVLISGIFLRSNKNS